MLLQALQAQNVTSLGNTIFADVINYIKMRSYWRAVGSTSNMTDIPIRRGDETEGEDETCDDRGTRQQGCVTMET